MPDYSVWYQQPYGGQRDSSLPPCYGTKRPGAAP
jgi:hypothetical protein